MGASRDLASPDLQPRPSVSSSYGRLLLGVNKSSSGAQSSATWTSTSGDWVSDTDEIDNRGAFVDEYNRLARKYGVRPLVPDDPESSGSETQLVVTHLQENLQSVHGEQCQAQTQSPETRGVFRIPGSVRVVNELYEFYCAGESGGDVANTVRSPSLPSHINAGVYDVASTFKKFLAGLPGGILGSLSLFDALVAINSQLFNDLEFSRTKQSKIRARLIALAVGTLRSQFRRELICSVFGLLCLLGRAAETAPREDEYGRPLPTSDLMGYNALGIVFGPLLVGDILGSHAVKLANPSAGLFLVPTSPQPKSKKEKKKSKESTLDEPQQAFLDVDRIHIVNDITEMLITNWRDVVRQMRSLNGSFNVTRHHSRASVSKNEPRRTGTMSRPPVGISTYEDLIDRAAFEDHKATPTGSSNNSTKDNISLKKTRPSSIRSASNTRGASKLGVLSPPREESGDECQNASISKPFMPLRSSLRSAGKRPQEDETGRSPVTGDNGFAFPWSSKSAPVPQSSKSMAIDSSTEAAEDSIPVRQGTPTRADRSNSVNAIEGTMRRRSSVSSAVDFKSLKSSKSVVRVEDPPGERTRPTFSCDLDRMATYAVVPGSKILSGKSTIRVQPRLSEAESRIEPAKQTPSRNSPAVSVGDNHESLQSATSSRPRNAAPLDQMDGAMDFNLSENPCRESIQYWEGESERHESINDRTSSSSDQNSQYKVPESQATKECGIPRKLRKSSRNSPEKQSPRSRFGDRGGVKLGASKVRGLAAMFDSAANTTPFVPTPGGSLQKKRRETAGVVSPYTSNLSPRASVNSATSVSTPASLMSRARNSVSSSRTAEHTGWKSMIPLRHSLGAADGSGKTERQPGPDYAQREEERLADGSHTVTRLPTPSRLPVRRKTSAMISTTLGEFDAQIDGSSTIPRSPLKLTAQQEIRPVEYHSSPVLPTTSSNGYTDSPHLYRHSTQSNGNHTINPSSDPSSHSPSPSRGQSESSLRDQIHSLRQELSSKSEECARLRLELQESTKAGQVGEVLLREDLVRARADCARWKRRAERAEKKVERFERLAMRIKDARDNGSDAYSRGEQDEFSFIRGPDHLDVGERTPQRQLSARMNQGARRMPEHVYSGRHGVSSLDGMSDCSGGTVVKNSNGGGDGDNPALWATVDELVNFASPGLAGDRM
ncbi:hypothetical protein SLS53_000347 [Cytospora paraplurivora]|uniref:Rho-GAP domain-containing protein n=1 Tax=Cytospora paraplurivora TaxID=2898453 RepID=A0AAN9UXG7_9PEZI